MASTLLKQVETEIAELILEKLENEEMDLSRASKIARFVLNSFPEGITDGQVKEIIPKLDDEFFELSGIVYEHMKEYEEKYKPFVLEEVEQLKQHEHFQEANHLMKVYFNKKLEEK